MRPHRIAVPARPRSFRSGVPMALGRRRQRSRCRPPLSEFNASAATSLAIRGAGTRNVSSYRIDTATRSPRPVVPRPLERPNACISCKGAHHMLSSARSAGALVGCMHRLGSRGMRRLAYWDARAGTRPPHRLPGKQTESSGRTAHDAADRPTDLALRACRAPQRDATATPSFSLSARALVRLPGLSQRSREARLPTEPTTKVFQ